MAVTYYGGNNITCLSTDTKPTNVPDGAKCIEIDTTSEYIKKDGSWVQMTSGSDGQIPIGSMADRPSASGHVGEYYYVNDSSPNQMFFSDGNTWVPVTTSPLMSFWDGATNDSTIPCTSVLSAFGTPPAAGTCAQTTSLSGYEAWHVFDGSTATYWRINGAVGYMAYYWGSGNGKKINKYRFHAYANYAPSSWLMERPADGVSSPDVTNDAHWTAIDQVATYSHPTLGWSPWFTFVAYSAIEAIRWRPLTTVNGIYIHEMQFINDTRS